ENREKFFPGAWDRRLRGYWVLLNPNRGDVAETPRKASESGRKSLNFAENVLYWAHYKPNPSAACMAPMGSRETIEQGRGSSARRLCHRKRVKRVLPKRPSKKPPRPAAAQQKAV